MHLDTAKELLEFLSPTEERWRERSLFRAQFEPEEGYQLLPSLYRESKKGSLLEFYKQDAKEFLNRNRSFQNLYSSKYAQVAAILNAAENFILKRFIEKANLLGIMVPESSSMLNWTPDTGEFMQWKDVFKLGFIRGDGDQITSSPETDSRYIETLKNIDKNRPPLFSGLAQHHGATTRLLDFSYNSYKALFHAVNCPSAKNSAKNGNSESVISLYWINESAFNRFVLKELSLRASCTPYDKNVMLASTYQIVKMPASDNHYLHQQEGLFVYPVFPYDYYLLTGSFPSLNNFSNSTPIDPKFRPLKRITIPFSEYNNLKIFLNRNNITLSRLFPNLDNVVKEMEDETGN